MAGHSDTLIELIAAVTTDMARLMAVAAKVRGVACGRPVRIDQVAAAGRMAWPVASELQRRGLSDTVRQAYNGAKRADVAFAKFMNSVAVSTTADQWGDPKLEVGVLEVDYDELRELSLQLQAETAALHDCYARLVRPE